MLEALLAEIRKGGTLEASALAASLGTTPGMVSAMLEHLQRSGYLKAYESCPAGCDGCGLKEGCKVSPSGGGTRIWQGKDEKNQV
jgi:hypothetical protein